MRVRRTSRSEMQAEHESVSGRWLAGLGQTRQMAQRLPGVQCICVADSEGDIYELMAAPRSQLGESHRNRSRSVLWRRSSLP